MLTASRLELRVLRLLLFDNNVPFVQNRESKTTKPPRKKRNRKLAEKNGPGSGFRTTFATDINVRSRHALCAANCGLSWHSSLFVGEIADRASIPPPTEVPG